MAVADHLQIDDTVTVSSAGFSPASPLIVALHGYGASEQDLVTVQSSLDEMETVSVEKNSGSDEKGDTK